MNAALIALSSQDILYQILSFDLLTQADLRSCCLVNSEWAAAGLILLWRYPKCFSLHSFGLLLDTLRHEDDLSGPLAPTVRRSATLREKSCSASIRPSIHTPSAASLIPTPYRPYREPKEYGIPFHGQRIYHRAQFIRKIDFNILANVLSSYHFEVLARSNKIGFRSLDLRTVRVPFSVHLLSILQNSKALKQLCLSNMHIPYDALLYLEPCFSTLNELRLIDCPDTMGDNELMSILQHSSQLRILEVRGESFTDKSLSWISKTCLDLETLVIEAPKMTDVVVEQIAAACPRISSWSLIDCTSIENGSVEALELKYSAPSQYIQSIPCRYNDMLGPRLDNINWSATGGSKAGTTSGNRSATTVIATSFSASSSTISSPSTSSMYSHSDMDPVLHSFNALDHAPSFALDRYTSTLEQSVNWGRLTTFEIRNCTGIFPSLLSPFLRSQTALEHLILGGISITDDSLVGLTETPLTCLQSLALYGCREISDETMVAVIFNCDQMKKLTIFGSNFTLRTFSSISLHLKQLEELHMEHVPFVMNESVQSILLKCSKLRVLKLWHCRSLTQDLFTDQDIPCNNLEELEFMDKFPRSYSGDGSKSQVKLLESLVTRFEHLRILRLAKLAESLVSVNLVSYLCQLDRLEKFTILENPGLDYEDLQELHCRLPSLIQIGLGSSEYLADNQIVCFTQSYHRPGIQMYSRMLESSEELDKYVN